MIKKLNGKPVTHLYFVKNKDGTTSISQHRPNGPDKITERMKRVLEQNKRK